MSVTDDQYLADDSMDPSDADSPVSSAPATGTSSPLFKSDTELSAKAAGKRTATAMLGVEYPNEDSRRRRSRVYDDDETPGGDEEEDDLPRRRYTGSSSVCVRLSLNHHVGLVLREIKFVCLRTEFRNLDR
ncbi:hypothetical protein BC936DRAFT_149406 [Jimgerdemannia flammicorona]|uniref:Uncharacterized protein n=1 Tax=Jimgerdemannia flammicorona TaxID=994334 RepID=A0A433D0V9_9FUNG|nr:hypothetical protein BC936DRAFT_149406 [Jimgerdemannia flammicorona]RUP44475.1 hypothetical protein BC936DRAFT_149406 [Jimgerdemannia flammicorona]